MKTIVAISNENAPHTCEKPHGICVIDDKIYFSDVKSSQIKLVSQDNTVSVYAGCRNESNKKSKDGLARQAQFI